MKYLREISKLIYALSLNTRAQITVFLVTTFENKTKQQAKASQQSVNDSTLSNKLRTVGAESRFDVGEQEDGLGNNGKGKRFFCFTLAGEKAD